METGVRNGYKLVEPDEKKWIDVVHSKGLFADCQTYKQAVALRWKLKCSPGSLIVDANRLRRERNAFLSLDNKWFHALDRISMPGVNLKSFARGPLDQGLTPHLEKALNYRQKETDPFRYVADGTPDTWFALNAVWRPEGCAERLPFRVVAGPDYVGEWKAKNGK